MTITIFMSVDDVMALAFNRPRDARSDAYKAGVRGALTFRMEHRHVDCPYALGTAEADAYFAGCDEGHHIWRKRESA